MYSKSKLLSVLLLFVALFFLFCWLVFFRSHLKRLEVFCNDLECFLRMISNVPAETFHHGRGFVCSKGKSVGNGMIICCLYSNWVLPQKLTVIRQHVVVNQGAFKSIIHQSLVHLWYCVISCCKQISVCQSKFLIYRC